MGQDTVAVMRVDDAGVIIAANPEAAEALSARAGRTCAEVVGARSRTGDAVCTPGCAQACAAGTSHPGPRHVALIDGRVAQLTCTRVGDETLVVAIPTDRQAHLFDVPLSPRERDVLELVAAGLSNPDIADALGIRPTTVRTHLEHLFHKLGATSRAEAVATAKDLGELP